MSGYDPRHLAELYASGRTYHQLQSEFHISEKKLRNILLEHGVTIRSKGGARNSKANKTKDVDVRKCDAPHLPFSRRCVLDKSEEQCNYCRRYYTSTNTAQSSVGEEPWGIGMIVGK